MYKCPNSNIGWNTFLKKDPNQHDTFIDKMIKEECILKKLDDYEIDNVNFIKIDVEGFEEDVINGFEELIMEFDFVIVEVIFDLYNSDKFYKIVNYMYGKGFCVSSILACPRHSDDTNKTADFLFNNFNKKLS